MGVWINDPVTGIQSWQGSQYLPSGGPVYAWGDWIDPNNPDAGRYAMDVAPVPSGYQHGLPSYQSINVGSDNYFKFGEFYYKQTVPEYNSDGDMVSGMGYDFSKRIPAEWIMRQPGAIPLTVNPQYNTGGDGLDLGMLAAFAGLVVATGGLAGALAPGAAAVGETSIAAETAGLESWLGTDIAVDTAASAATSATATTGATSMGEIGNLSGWLENYSADAGVDPFATTADVNAGWSYDGGYSGVNWYNNAGTGEAPGIWESLNKGATEASKLIKTLGGALSSGAAAVTQTRNNLAQQQPNYQRAAGSLNLGLLAAGLLAWKLL